MPEPEGQWCNDLHGDERTRTPHRHVAPADPEGLEARLRRAETAYSDAMVGILCREAADAIAEAHSDFMEYQRLSAGQREEVEASLVAARARIAELEEKARELEHEAGVLWIALPTADGYEAYSRQAAKVLLCARSLVSPGEPQ